ncbi:hypothetical protein Np450711_151 [Cyanophage S-RIM14]|uniref:Uncharacterized protein n=1 Tax=Cyanophage S-RIM14 TaxID=1278423 RepID=A0A1D7SKQ7_9CAUD|nr:hypothetical protein LIS110610_151 [Cyanophage S-RIM14]AOO13913.1 hypothetical protein Np450711_151 [Cyanophage S-RIM14]AOO14129.1 hypothetical protein RW030110_151 [Cyanophage S-RIM14]AOO14565.1 hypothetical protein Sn180910_151 [Cyanophage S-RIM14]
MEINDIDITGIDIQDVRIPESRVFAPNSLPLAPPVTLELGFPIVNVPGCVESHSQNSTKNNNLIENDPKGTITYCDAGVPSYDPLQFEPDKIVPTYPSGIDTRRKEPKPPTPETPAVPKTPTQTVTYDCPARDQELKNPIGKILEGNKKITGYELVGKECIEVTEDLGITDQIVSNIPNAGMVTTTASIAVIATSSALLAKPVVDLLLKVVKPTVKKVLKKVSQIRGKISKIESVSDRRRDQRHRNRAIRILRGKE